MRFGPSSLNSLCLAYAIQKAAATNAAIGDASAVINRQLEASIQAHDWPTAPSNPLCEAFAYIDSAPEGSNAGIHKAWKRSYLESLMEEQEVVDRDDDDDDDNPDSDGYVRGVEKAVQAATKFFKEQEPSSSSSENIDMKLLRYALATRAHAPLCEMHRSLAHGALLGVFPQREMAHRALNLGAFAILPNRNEDSGANANYQVSYMYATGVNGDGLADFVPGLHVADVVGRSLPEEDTIHEYATSTDSEAVLYGNFDSPAFATLYKALVKQSIPFVVRHMGAALFSTEDDAQALDSTSTDSGIGGTALQGYGVRLDIRNVEYKSFDDKADAATDQNTVEQSDKSQLKGDAKYEQLNSEEIKDLFTNGIDPTALEHPSPGLLHFLNDYLPQLNLGSDDDDNAPKDHIHIPPKSELTDLPIQTTHVITQSKDPLWTLQQLSQNLPSFASSLANVTVPLKIKERITSLHKVQGMAMQRYGSGSDGVMSFHVNGRTIQVERPSFNLFQLINVIREENELLKSVKDLDDLSHESKRAVAEFLAMGKEEFDNLSNDNDDDDGVDGASPVVSVEEPKLRVNVGSGYRGAVIYLNDIEKDPEYRNFPNSIQQALMSFQYRGTLTIRRNLLTALIVLDPFNAKPEFLDGMRVLLQMMQGGIPLRVGILFSTDKDIDFYKNCVASNTGSDDNCFPPGDTAGKVAASDVMKLCQSVMAKYGKSIGMPYLYLTLMGLRGKNGMTVKDLANTHITALQKMGVTDEDPYNFVKEAVLEHTDTANYATALKFAVSKNIRPGMGFINGIPIMKPSPDEYESALMEEMQNMAEMMVSGEITETSPRSIYALMLKGRNVRKSMHSLFSEESPQYRIGATDVDTKSIFKLNENDGLELPTIMFEVVTDFTSRDGLNHVLSFLKALSATKIKIDDLDRNEQTNIAFRVAPSDPESSKRPLAAIFRQLSQFNLDTLIEFVEVTLLLHESSQEVELDSYGKKAKKMLQEDDCLADSSKCSFESIPAQYQSSTMVYANGRVYSAKTIEPDDIDALITLERAAAKTIVDRLGPHLKASKTFEIEIARVAAILAEKFASETFIANERSDILAPYRKVAQDNSLHFIWNSETEEDSFGVKVSVLLDPLSAATQRAAPLLRIIRDTLKLPIELVILPRAKISEDSSLPLTSYYRFVAGATNLNLKDKHSTKAYFEGLPANQVLTIRMDVPEPWDIQQSSVTQDTDNLRCDTQSCGDDAYAASLKKNRGEEVDSDASFSHLTKVEYSLNSLLLSGQCYDVSSHSPPNGLQLTLSDTTSSQKDSGEAEYEILPDGSVSGEDSGDNPSSRAPSAGTLVMKTVGYWQLRSRPGIWQLNIAENTKGAEMYQIVEGSLRKGRLQEVASDQGDKNGSNSKMLVMKDFVNSMELILVKRNEGYESEELLAPMDTIEDDEDDTVHVFSLATGHLYERFLKIMMLSVTKRTSVRVKFWFLENFLSPSFKASAFAMAEEIGCDIEFVTYKWPEWLRAQSEKQRIIWGYKILFLDVLFPLNLKKIIYVDADQVVRGDLKELWDMDLKGAPYGYTPMCESREETKGYQFWREGFWPNHLQGKPYHISALYVVDLQRFRRELVGDQLRSVYQQLTADPNNLSNLDQDLPNYTQHQIRIFSLPQDWLWCESWCSEDTKVSAKTIDLCNNPEHKEPKVLMAKRIISGELFEESWVDLDAEVDAYERKYLSLK